MTPLPEHWQYAALGALSMTPVLGVFWSVARGWRLKVVEYDHWLGILEGQRANLANKMKAESETASTLADQVIELTIKLNDERALTADQSARLNRIIARGKTKNPNSTVKAMVRIAEGG